MVSDPVGSNLIFKKEHAPLWIFVAMGAVSTAAILIRLSDSHPLTIAMWRLIISVVILAPFSLPAIRKDLHLIDRRTFLVLVLVGLTLALHFGLWIWSFEYTTVASSVLLVTTHPLFVAVISYIAFGERLGRKAIFGMVLAFIGSFLIIGGDISFQSDALLGNILALSGGFMAGIYLLSGSHLRKRLSLLSYAFLVYSPAALFMILTVVLFGVQMVPLEAEEYLIFTLLALGPMLAGHTIYNWALKYVSPTLVSVSLLGEPVGSTILAFLILNESPGFGALLGGPVILAGIFMVVFYGQRKKKEGSEP